MADFLNDAFATARQFQGLAAVKQQMEQQKREQENIKLGTEALNKYRESVQAGAPDEMSMTTALIYHPEAAKNVLAHVGIQDQIQKRDAANFIMQAAAAGDDPEKLLSLTRSRLSYLKQGQRDPTHTGQLEQMLLSGDISGAKSSIKGIAAALVGDGSLDKKAYDLAYGPAPGSMDDYQKATIALREKELAAQQSAQQRPGDIERNWKIYQDLLKTDPEAAAKFGNAARFEPQSGDVGLQQKIADAKASGKIVAEAKANLPKVESAARFVKGYVEGVLNHEGRPWSTGLISLAPTVRGTRQADFRKRMDQLTGASFLSAFESLRGGGQITQIEGEKATAAINRMNVATNDDEFNSAAKDFLDVVDSGVKNARDLASGKAMRPIEPDQSPAAQGASKYKIEVVQ